MKSIIFVLLGISCIALQHCNGAAINADSLDVQWKNFKIEYHKTFTSDEKEQFRKEIFRQNLEIINAHNEKYRNHEVAWEMGINEFTDMTSDEIKERLGFGKQLTLLAAPSSLDVEWENFKIKYNKFYSSDEENFRKEIFSKNFEIIKTHNEKYRNHEVTWEMGVNEFTDMTAEEIKERLGFGKKVVQLAVQNPLEAEWENFKTEYNKSYSSDEEKYRKQIFKQNFEIINAHNEKYRNHEVTWEMGINEFTDLTLEEMKERLGFGKQLTLLAAPSSLDVEWEKYKTNYNKSYTSAQEEQLRKEIFRRKLEMINTHNEKYRNHEVTWEMGINIFTDLTAEEIKFMLGFGLRYKDYELDAEWDNFKTKYNKFYSSDEENFRKEIFRQNFEIINAHNEKYRNHEVTWEMGVNEFTDMTAEEIKERLGFGKKVVQLAVQNPLEAEWENFKTEYNKSYSSDEEKYRKQIFKQNFEIINAHNEKYRNHEVTWEMGINEFTDLTLEEMKERLGFGKQLTLLAAPSSLDVEWEKYKTNYNKSYTSAKEEQLRKEIFRRKLEMINTHNEKYRNHEVTWEMGINIFTDLTAEEIKFMLGFGLRYKDYELDAEWDNFKTKYNKFYSSDEENFRKEIFRQNFEIINAHNKKYRNHEVTWKMGVNEFTDMTAEEIKERLGFGKNVVLAVENPLEAEWENFKIEFHKSYPSGEEEYRKKIFKENFEIITSHNEKYLNREVTWEMGINEFTDLTSEEFKERLGLSVGLGLSSKLARAMPITSKNKIKDLPNEVDWYKYGFQTRVMNQGVCGSCYAMAVTGAIESHYYIKHKEFIQLSQQELVDCSKTYGNMGCAYGDLKNTFTYIMDNGIGTYDQNPYRGWEGECKNNTKPRYHINGFIQTAEEDEEDLKRAVAIGPVIAVINTGLNSFQLYKGGVYYDENCHIDPTSVNHFVLILGYGTNKDGDDYWLIKSSWGTNWGLGGYMFIARNRDNQCGIATEAMYPVL